jgi:hypothetical protein
VTRLDEVAMGIPAGPLRTKLALARCDGLPEGATSALGSRASAALVGASPNDGAAR